MKSKRFIKRIQATTCMLSKTMVVAYRQARWVPPEELNVEDLARIDNRENIKE